MKWEVGTEICRVDREVEVLMEVRRWMQMQKEWEAEKKRVVK